MSEFLCAQGHLMSYHDKRCNICGAPMKYMDGIEDVIKEEFDELEDDLIDAEGAQVQEKKNSFLHSSPMMRKFKSRSVK